MYEKQGDHKTSQKIYISLAKDYPKSRERPAILHEAARFSLLVKDHSRVRHYGEKFMKEFPDHPLGNNVTTFLLQSLFTAREYKAVIEVCEKIRKKYQAGDPARELADHVYGAALYFLGNHYLAQEPLDMYAEKYPDSENREAALYWQASNYIILGKFTKSAGLFDAYLKEFPQSRYRDLALFDRSACHFNLEEYEKSIAMVDRIKEEHRKSVILDRALNLAGDAYDALAGLETEDADIKNALTDKALQYFRLAIVEGKIRHNKRIVAEALARAADLSIRLELWDDAVRFYDDFFPDYVGTLPWEPQISVFTMEALEKLGRGEDGLKQLEKMIISMGERVIPEQDTELLRQAIGSYSEASVRSRGAEKTAAIFDNFPGVNADNQALLTWLKVQKIIVLQALRNDVKKDSPEYEKFTEEIDKVFKEMENFEVRNLSEFARQQLGLYLSMTDNPFLAVPYFEALLARDDDAYKAQADFELGKIEMRRSDDASLNRAVERFKRVIFQYQEKGLISESYMNLGRLAVKQERWQDALEYFGKINKSKKWLNRAERAEANFKYGLCLEKLGKTDDAIKVYNAVIAVYGSYIEWSSQALERGFELSYSSGDPEKKIKAYAYLRKIVYMFQNASASDSPSGALGRMRRRLAEVRNELGLTAEQLREIDESLGITKMESAKDGTSSSGKRLSPIEILELGRRLMKLERWQDAREHIVRICKNKGWLSQEQRAESNFRNALCLEKMGRTDDAIRTYNGVIAVYASYAEWSTQALERGFNLSYKINDHDKKVKAYAYLKKKIHAFKDVKHSDDPSGSLTRLRKRLPEIVKELALTAEKVNEIDIKLGIAQNRPED